MMAAKWLRFALVCFVIPSPFIRAEDADDSQTSKKHEGKNFFSNTILDFVQLQAF